MKKRIFSLLLCLAMLLTLLPQTVLFASAATSGTCGTNLRWSYNSSTYTLTVTGSGAMTNWSSYSSVPWYSYRSSIRSVSLPDGLTSIGYAAFYDCTGLTAISIPDSVTSIGGYAFYDCTGLTSITIPSGVTSIGNYAFEWCAGLTAISIPDSVTSIGGYAFAYCTGLTAIAIPDSVTSIGSSAFYGCTGLTAIAIPDSVTSIGSSAFYRCTGLTDIAILNPNCSVYNASGTLAGNAKTTVYGYPGSTAQTYANKYGYTFKTLDQYPYEFPSASDGEKLFLGNEYTATINEHGTAYAYYYLLDSDGNPMPNTDYSYEVSFRGQTLTYYSHTYTTDSEGKFTLETPILSYSSYEANTFDAVFKLKLKNSDKTLKYSKYITHVTITPYTFKEVWSFELGNSQSILVVKAGQSNKASLTLSHKADGTQDIEMKLEMSDALSAKAKLDDKYPDTDISLFALSSGSEKTDYTAYSCTIENYDAANPDHREKLSAFFTVVLYVNLMDNITASDVTSTLFLKAQEPLVQTALDELFDISEVGVKVSSSDNGVPISIPLDIKVDGSPIEISLIEPLKIRSLDTKTTYSYATIKEDDQLSYSAAFKFDEAYALLAGNTLPLVGSGGLNGYAKQNEFSFTCSDDILSARIGKYDTGWTEFIDNNDQRTDSRTFTADGACRKALLNSSVELMKLSKGIVGITELEKAETALKAFRDTDHLLRFSDTVKHAGNFKLDPSVKFGLPIEGLSVSAGFSLSASKSYEFETASGVYWDGQILPTAVSNVENTIGTELCPQTELTDLLGDAVKGIGDSFADLLESAKALVSEGVALGSAAIEKVDEELNNWKVYLSSLLPGSRQKQLTRSGTSISAMVGVPYLVSVFDENDTEITDLSEQPLALTLSYTSEDLEAAGVTDPASLGIYRFDYSAGKYIRIGGTAGAEVMSVTATITQPGEYVLFADSAAPELIDVSVSDASATPTVTAVLSDLSEIAAISLTIDSVPVENISEYYDTASGLLSYQIPAALSVGTHTLILTATDAAGNANEAALQFTVNEKPVISSVDIPAQIEYPSVVEITAQVQPGQGGQTIAEVRADISAEIDSEMVSYSIQLTQAEGFWSGSIPISEGSKELDICMTAIDNDGCFTTSDDFSCIVFYPHEHEVSHVAAVPAACTEYGSAEYYTCTEAGCEQYGKMFLDEGLTEELTQSEIYPLGHDLEIIPATAATCTEPAYSASCICTRCGLELVAAIATAAPLGHSFVDGVCVCGAELKISSAALRLNENINMVYSATLPEEAANPYMVFNYHGEEITVNTYTRNEAGQYCFELADINPQCMGDTISATLYATCDGTEYTDTIAEYSVRDYCVNLLAKTDDAALKTLLSDILTYGAAAQVYKDYKTDALVTEGLDLTPSTFEAISGKTVSFTGEQDETTCWTGAALVLSNDLATRFTFVTDNTDGLTVEVAIDGRTQTFNAFEEVGDGRYYITFYGIQATEFDDTVTATFYRNGEQLGATVNYSVNTYICNTQNSTNAPLAALVKALYNYGASAKAYANR